MGGGGGAEGSVEEEVGSVMVKELVVVSVMQHSISPASFSFSKSGLALTMDWNVTLDMMLCLGR